MLLADEIQHGQAALAPSAPETTAELLREERRGRSRPQEQDDVYVRDVDSLAEHLDREDTSELAGLQVTQALVPNLGRVIARQRDAPEAGFGELTGHVAGMFLRHAETQRAHLDGVKNNALNCLNELPNSDVVAREEVAQLLSGISAAPPGQLAQVGAVGNPEVLELGFRTFGGGGNWQAVAVVGGGSGGRRLVG